MRCSGLAEWGNRTALLGRCKSSRAQRSKEGRQEPLIRKFYTSRKRVSGTVRVLIGDPLFDVSKITSHGWGIGATKINPVAPVQDEKQYKKPQIFPSEMIPTSMDEVQ